MHEVCVLGMEDSVDNVLTPGNLPGLYCELFYQPMSMLSWSSGREARGWDLVYTSPVLERAPQHVALRTKVGGGSHLGDKLLAAVLGTEVRVWTCSPTQRELSECVV